MSAKPEYETWPFPPTVKNLGDKKSCKVIRKGIWDKNGGSFTSRLAPSGMTCTIELPEEAIFGISDEEQRERALRYWKKYDDMPCNALMSTVDALVKISEDDDGREALRVIETLRFELELLDEPEEQDDNTYVVKKEGTTLIVVIRHAYADHANDQDPGSWSGLAKFRAKFEAVLGSETLIPPATSAKGKPRKPEYETWAYPPTVRNLSDKISCKVIRKGIWDKNSGSFMSRLAPSGMTCKIELPEETIFGITNEEQRERALRYWKKYDDMPCNALMSTVDALVKISEDDDGREALGRIEILRFVLELLEEAEEEDDKTYVVKQDGTTLTVVIRHAYAESTNDQDPGAWSGLAKFRAKFEAVLGSETLIPPTASAKGKPRKPEYETWPYPSTVKNLSDKISCKVIRKGIWDKNGGSFISRLAPSGMTCKIELPEDTIFGIEDEEQRERALRYWKKYDDMPCNALMSTVDALVKLCEDADGKEELGQIETLRFELELLEDPEEEDDKAYVVRQEGKTLIVVIRHAYSDRANDQDPGSWSGLAAFRAKFEAVLGSDGAAPATSTPTKGKSKQPEYETWPFPSTVRNLSDKKSCKVIRKGIWDKNGGSFISRLAPSGMTCKIELPEEAIFGIEDEEQRERALRYWKKYDDMPCNALMSTVDALVKLCEDADGKEALGEIETLRFELELLEDPEEEDDKTYVVKKEGNTLIVVIRHAYSDHANDQDPGAWSGLAAFRAKFENVL